MERIRKNRRFHIDERYVTVNLTLSIILYSVVVPFCIYLGVDNLIRGDLRVARYAFTCATMTAIATICFAICKFGKKRRRWLMHLAINIQCFVYWGTFYFFLYTGYQFPESYYSRLPMMYLVNVIMCGLAQYETVKAKIKQEKALEEARRASEAKTDFLANTSHEIRTPINAVLGMNEMIMRESSKAEKLKDGKPSDYQEAFKKIRQYSGNVDSAGNNLLAIINDILDFTKIEEGKMKIVEVEYQLSSVINDVSNMIFFKAKEKNLSFVTDVDESIPDHLFGDVVRIRQVITNILNNAVKYTEKGSVSLKITGKRMNITASGKPVMELIVSVSDTGIGISEENIAKLFGKFERVDLEKNSTKEGTGLGLAITKMLLQMMHGDIKVESTYGEGSTFTITIPQLVLSEEPVGNFTEKFEKELGGKKEYHESFRAPDAKILIVDDTKMNLVVATEFLKDTKVNIDTAEGGKEAVALALQNKYDVILMDQRMPEMDGEETLKVIKSHEEGIDSTSLEKMLKKYIPSEKIELVSKEEKASSEPIEKIPEKSDASEFAALSECGVDPEKGTANCGGDKDFYLSILKEYQKDADEKKTKLMTFLEKGDLKDYAILIHSLKSTSATIGAMAPSKLAKDLEAAANNDDKEYILENQDAFLKEYDIVLEAIGKVISEDDKTVSSDPDDEILEFLPEGE